MYTTHGSLFFVGICRSPPFRSISCLRVPCHKTRSCVAYRPAEPAWGRAQSDDVCWIRVPRLARVTYIAQLSRLVAVRRLKTNAPSELQGHRIIAHTPYPTLCCVFLFIFLLPESRILRQSVNRSSSRTPSFLTSNVESSS